MLTTYIIIIVVAMIVRGNRDHDHTHQGFRLRRGVGNAGKYVLFLAETYGPGLKIRLRKKTHMRSRRFLPPFSTQNLDMGITVLLIVIRMSTMINQLI